MADISAMLSSGSNHYGTPPLVCDAVREFYEGWPRMDPATNPDAYMRAQIEYGLPFDLDSESVTLEKKLSKKAGKRIALTAAQWDALEAKGRDIDDRARARGIILQDSYGVPWIGPGWFNPSYDDMARAMKQVSLAQDEWLVLTVARTSAKWFHSYIFQEADAVLFFDERLNFLLDGKPTGSAPFDSALAYYTGASTAAATKQLRSKFSFHFSQFGKVILLP